MVINLSHDFGTLLRPQLGNALYDRLIQGLEVDPTVSIRLNPAKTNGWKAEGEAVPWCPEGRYLSSRPEFTFDPLMHAGLYYVQEASSMFLAHVLRTFVHEPAVMLDLCAAPGGKSGVALTALPEGSLLFTNEALRPRASILAENLSKTGATNTIVTSSWAAAYGKTLRETFDVMLCDVPCSGEGMFRKDPGAVADWSLKKVNDCQGLQRQIVSDAWAALKPGGLLIYSTCTFNLHEDEENALWIARELGADFMEVPVETEWNITPSLVDGVTAYRFLPGLTRGEGLFMTVLRKHGSAKASAREKTDSANKRHVALQEGGRIAHAWLTDSASVAVVGAIRLMAIPQKWKSLYDKALRGLNILQAGVPLATPKGRDYQPDAALALSTGLRRGAFPEVDLNYGDAIHYLRREPVTLPEGTPRGYVLVTYQGEPLGFEKNIGTRANNLFPQEWKIRSGYLPAEPQEVLRR